MKAFFDSSAFAKRFVEEAGSQAVEDLCAQTTELGLSVICIPEVVSALNRLVREKFLTRSQYLQAKQRLLEDVRDAAIIHLTPNVIRSSLSVLEASPTRAMDALQVACAVEWHADLFVSADVRQTAAAEKARLRTRRI